MTGGAADPHCLAFAGAQTLRTADAACEALRAALAEHRVVSLDCSGVTEADLAFAQLLLAADATVRGSGASVTLRAPLAGPLAAALVAAGIAVAEVEAPDGTGAVWFAGAAS
jgi:hypothetical protein